MPTKEAYKRSMSYSRTGFWLSMIGAGLIILQGLIAMFFSSIVFGGDVWERRRYQHFFLGHNLGPSWSHSVLVNICADQNTG